MVSRRTLLRLIPAAAVLPAAVPFAVNQVAQAANSRPKKRVISFAGHDWLVKTSEPDVWGPGPNYFSNSKANVWVDNRGRLHLRITKVRGRWQCAEVINQASLGHGTYRWELDSPVGGLDPQVVLGLFTWNDDPAYNHREIDIEFARWGDGADPKSGQYTVQPHQNAGNLIRTSESATAAPSSCSFTWAPGSVSFARDVAAPASAVISGPDVPVPGGENVRMNLWLFRGLPPQNLREVEVIISGFSFTPAD